MTPRGLLHDLREHVRFVSTWLAIDRSRAHVLHEKRPDGEDGLVDVKVCAIDDVWSGLKLVVRKELR